MLETIAGMLDMTIPELVTFLIIAGPMLLAFSVALAIRIVDAMQPEVVSDTTTNRGRVTRKSNLSR